MTTEIQSIKTAETQSISVTQRQNEEELSTATKKELEALGITVTEGMTEAEAQEKIAEAKIQQVQLPAAPDETEVLADIKTLAAAIGLNVDDTASSEELLTQIAEELEAQVDEAEGNPQELSTLLSYYRQLSTLDAQFDEIQAGQDKIYAEMNLISENNKKAFGFE